MKEERVLFAVIIFSALALVGCGGGGNDNPVGPGQVVDVVLNYTTLTMVLNQEVTITARGGDGQNYQWSVTGGGKVIGSGPTITLKLVQAEGGVLTVNSAGKSASLTFKADRNVTNSVKILSVKYKGQTIQNGAHIPKTIDIEIMLEYTSLQDAYLIAFPSTDCSTFPAGINGSRSKIKPGSDTGVIYATIDSDTSKTVCIVGQIVSSDYKKTFAVDTIKKTIFWD